MTEFRDGKRIISTPVSDEDIRDLKIGDVFYLDGELATGRDVVHSRVVEESMDLPVDIRDKAIFHAGPIVRDLEDGSYEMIAVGPTTSMRMEKYAYDFIKATGAKIMIGKGGMKANAEAACRELGAIHCIYPAGNAVVGASTVEEIMSADWLDLGRAEAVWYCKVKEFGPLIVTIDTNGRNFFEEKKVEYNKRKEEQLARISSQLHFI